MNRIWKALVLVACCLGILATSKERQVYEPSYTGTIDYYVVRTLWFEPETGVHEARVNGKRCYIDVDGDQVTHEFVFDDERDRLIVQIDDADGVLPGESYALKLYFKDRDGPTDDEQAFDLVVSHPSSALRAVHSFTFNFGVGTDGEAAIASGTPLGGLYQTAETDRNIEVTLTFSLAAEVGHVAECMYYY